VLKIVSRSPIVLKALITVAEELRAGNRSIKEMCRSRRRFDRGKGRRKDRQTLRIIDKIAKLHELGLKQLAKLEATGIRTSAPFAGQSRRLSRTRVGDVVVARSLNSRSASAKADRMAPPPGSKRGLEFLEREAARLERAPGRVTVTLRWKRARNCVSAAPKVKEIEEVERVERARLSGFFADSPGRAKHNRPRAN